MNELFERYALDPLATPAEITERMRELVELAPEPEREALRAAWERLTLHPRERIAAAVRCFVDLEPPLEPPPRRASPPHPTSPASAVDLCLLPPLEASLGAGGADLRDALDLDRDPWPRELSE
jgi:hypothetical protein